MGDDRVICSTCEVEYGHRLHWLLTIGMPTLRSVAFKQASFAIRSPGRASKPFAGTPLNEEAHATYDATEHDLQFLGGELNWQPLGTTTDGLMRTLREWDWILPRLRKHVGALAALSTAVEDYRMVTADCERVKQHISRQSENLLVGICPECEAETYTDPETGETLHVRTSIYAPKGTTYAACPRCGSMLDLLKVRADYLDSIGGFELTCTPSDASDYLLETMGIKVSRKTISMWLKRGKLPRSQKLGKGKWIFNLSDLLICANTNQKAK
jgi:DNA-directed RNA polymerase subunit RPC12/RpoP